MASDFNEQQRDLLRGWRETNILRGSAESDSDKTRTAECAAAEQAVAGLRAQATNELTRSERANQRAGESLRGVGLNDLFQQARASRPVAIPATNGLDALLNSASAVASASDDIQADTHALWVLRAKNWSRKMLMLAGGAGAALGLIIFAVLKIVGLPILNPSATPSSIPTGVSTALPNPTQVALANPTPVPSLAPSPTFQPAFTPTPDISRQVKQIMDRVDPLWSAGDWPGVIKLLLQARTLDPANGDVIEKLFSAYINNGQDFEARGQKADAAQQYIYARDLKPDDRRAQDKLNGLTPTPTPVPQVLCQNHMRPQSTFYYLWLPHYQEIGCPRDELALGADHIYFIEQPFEKGHLFFFSSDPVFIVFAVYGTPGSGQTGTGTWQKFSSQAWTGRDENFCGAGNGLKPPVFDNFNTVWCQPDVRARLGGPTDMDTRQRENLFGTNARQYVLAQGFDNGLVLRDSDGAKTHKAYLLLNNGNFIRDGF